MFWATLLKVTSSFVVVSLQYGQRTPRQDAASTATPKDSEYLTAKVFHPHILQVCRWTTWAHYCKSSLFYVYSSRALTLKHMMGCKYECKHNSEMHQPPRDTLWISAAYISLNGNISQ